MAYSLETINKLAHLVIPIGGVENLNKLPQRTINQALTMSDEVFIVKPENFVIKLTGLVGGYTVFNAEMAEVYSVEEPVNGSWGYDLQDAAWFMNMPSGEYFFVAYQQEDLDELDGVQGRMLMLIRTGSSLSRVQAPVRTIPAHVVTYEDDLFGLEYWLEIPPMTRKNMTMTYDPGLQVEFVGGRVHEKGEQVDQVRLEWTPNRLLEHQEILEISSELSQADRYFVVQGPFTEDVTWTYRATDGVDEVTATTELKFLSRRFWGTTDQEAITQETLYGLSHELAQRAPSLRRFDCTGGKFIVVAYPAAWGEVTFKSTNHEFNGMVLSKIDVINQHGHTEPYNVYRSQYRYHGDDIPLEVTNV